jgi:N-acetylglucosamine-6-phosphate deacetylase
VRTNPGILLTGRLVTPLAIINDGAVVVDGDRIVFGGKAAELPQQWRDVQAPAGWTGRHTLLPGLVDVHCHGGAGGEFGPDAASARVAVDHHHHRGGTTSLLGSLVSNTHDALVGGVSTCAALVAQGDLAGIHLEGPFLSMRRRGAQNPAALCDVDAGLVEAWPRQPRPQAHPKGSPR